MSCGCSAVAAPRYRIVPAVVTVPLSSHERHAVLTMRRDPSVPLTRNHHLLRWVEKMTELTRPAGVHWVDGSQEENDELIAQMVRSGTLLRLNQETWPGCYYARSDASDVARVEQRTFICSLSKDAAGPTNNWVNPYEMRRKLKELFNGAMRGPDDVRAAVQHGDRSARRCRRSASSSPTRPTSSSACGSWRASACRSSRRSTGTCKRVVPCMHSVGAPLAPGQQDVPWPCNDEKYIVHFPETREIWSYGSGYGGNALLGKKCFGAAHRLEHRARRRLDGRAHADPRRRGSARREDLHRGGVPERVRQDELRDADSARRHATTGRSRPSATTSPGSSRTPTDACARSIPKRASSASRPGTSAKTNPNAMATIAKNTIFTNVALTPEGGVWWEGMTDEPPAECLDWQGDAGRRRSAKATGKPAAHPNARFTAPLAQCPIIDPAWERPGGRADQRVHLRRPPRDDDAAGLSGVQLERRRLHRRDDGLGDDGRRGRQRRQGPPRSDGDAAVLRLSHGRLLPALDQDAAVAAARRRRSST